MDGRADISMKGLCRMLPMEFWVSGKRLWNIKFLVQCLVIVSLEGYTLEHPLKEEELVGLLGVQR